MAGVGALALAFTYLLFGLRPRQKDHLRPGIQDQTGQHSETHLHKKLFNLAVHGSASLGAQLLRRLKWEDQLSMGGQGCREP
ncbi:hypothetical protein AAY473_007491 [Plecturocebus cupreus]